MGRQTAGRWLHKLRVRDTKERKEKVVLGSGEYPYP